MCPAMGFDESSGSTPVNLLEMLPFRPGGDGKFESAASRVSGLWLAGPLTPMPVGSSGAPCEFVSAVMSRCRRRSSVCAWVLARAAGLGPGVNDGSLAGGPRQPRRSG